MIKGIDISSYQHGGPIDFSQVEKSGHTFVIVKATEGVDYKNPYFRSDVQRAHTQGLLVGAYTFFRPEQDAVAQANELLRATEGLHLDFPLVIDIEEKPDTQDARHVHERLDQVRAVLHQHGHKTMTYSYAPFIEANLPHECRSCASDPLWLAAYEDKVPAAPKPWSEIAIWQCSQTGRVAGISGSVDEDVELKNLLASPRQGNGLPDWYHRVLENPPSKLRDPGEVKNGLQSGPDVAAVQRKLAIKVDGFFGPTTEAHIKGFQKLVGLAVDGRVGPETARKLQEKR